jgi:hypothetical protein
MVDYSKWDKLSISSEDQDDEIYATQPRVTHFSEPQSITFGGLTGTHNHDTPQSRKQTERVSCLESPKNVKKEYQPSLDKLLPSSLSKNASRFSDTTLYLENATKNGGVTDQYVWSQSKTEVVCIYWDVPQHIRGRDITVLISTDDKNLEKKHVCKTNNLVDACGQDTVQTLQICINDKEYLKKSFPYAVLRDDNHFFWEVKKYDTVDSTNCTKNVIEKIPASPFKALMLTVTKSIIIYNTVIWWNCMFAGDPSVDVTCFQERSSEKIKKQKETFQKTWDSAHTSFLQSIKQNATNPIPLKKKQ